jgi:hypothetical protein
VLSIERYSLLLNNVNVLLIGTEARVVHLLDFGLCREYVVRNQGKIRIRKPRSNVLFRGTARYCSISTHQRNEQGRVDDLFSMIYVLVEMRGVLPWHRLKWVANL